MALIEPFDDHYFMKKALDEAKIAFDKGEVPVGAIIVFKEQIIARGYPGCAVRLSNTVHQYQEFRNWYQNH